MKILRNCIFFLVVKEKKYSWVSKCIVKLVRVNVYMCRFVVSWKLKFIDYLKLEILFFL